MSLTRRLRAAGREPELPLEIRLDVDARVEVVRWLRVLPGKRLVGLALHDGQPRLLKLFVAAGAERHCRRELEGIRALQAQNIPTPALLGSGVLDGGGQYLLSVFLDEAQSLQQCWLALSSRAPGAAPALTLLGQALAVIARMHASGLVQTDLHLGNFLLHGQQLYVIDGDAVQVLSPGSGLNARQVEDNLAIFFAQLDPEWDALSELLLVSYLEVYPLALDPDRLAERITAVRQRRLGEYLDKALRDCTDFAVQRSWFSFTAVVRREAARLGGLLARPDALLDRLPLLKDGGSSTVGRVPLDSGEVVVKRYNIKGLSHWMTRFWRPSRAWHSWLAAHRLRFLGIATPAPLAMIEQRFGPLRRRAWLVTEYCSGVDLLRHLGEDGGQLPDVDTLSALKHLFGQLVAARISHGDFKATNLLWHNGRIWLIDLDAMQQHRSDDKWTQAWSRDRARFIRNWPADSPLANWLEVNLP